MPSPDTDHAVRGFLEVYGPLPPEQWEAFRGAMRVRAYAAGEFFQRPEEPPRDLGLVLSGLFRIYYQDGDGKEFTRSFSDEGKPIGDYACALERAPANVNIMALEASKVAVITFDDYFAMFDRHPCWNLIGRKVIETFYVNRERREAEFVMLTAGQRYDRFVKTSPRLAARLSNAHVASYLGMTPETLSRLKRALKKSG